MWGVESVNSMSLSSCCGKFQDKTCSTTLELWAFGEWWGKKIECRESDESENFAECDWFLFFEIEDGFGLYKDWLCNSLGQLGQGLLKVRVAVKVKWSHEEISYKH